jgi:hypothetical protein
LDVYTMYTDNGFRPGCFESCDASGATGIGLEGQPPEQHFWNFTGCTTGTAVNDGSVGGISVIQAMNSGGTCGDEGMILDGTNSFIALDSFMWGGESSLEIYVQIGVNKPNSIGLLDFHEEPDPSAPSSAGAPTERSYLGINDKGRLVFMATR